MYLLDTNVISELRKPGAHSNVTAWAASVPASSLFTTVIVLLELEMGILQRQRHDPLQAMALRRWFEQDVVPTFDRRTYPVDKQIALQCARLHVPDPRPDRDALIAATALVHNLTVVTRNTADFEPMGVPLLNPWTVNS